MTEFPQGTDAAIAAHYDVIIMGGGPAGSTLAAQLKRTSDLSVAIFDKEIFPREHIGESLAHPTLPAMQEIGFLPKLLASDVWVQKFGGIFNWEESGPSVGFFDHDSYLEDGEQRWTAHVNRSEFDHLLLEHAIDCGASVFQGVSVKGFTKVADGCEVSLKDGPTVHGRFFVDASGRRNSIVSKSKRDWLSTYKNIAIWQHFVGGKSSYEIPGDWNIFAERKQSAITCAAFEDGWCWYIPVKKVIDGQRVVTHSVGLVTIPAILQEEGKDFTDPEIFLKTVKTVPMIGDLVQDAQPVGTKMRTATNYSMINESFSNFDGGWLLVGDAAYFVDPLFSSGVAFAMGHALSAALLLKTSADAAVPDEHKRDLWGDYDREWHGIAQSFSLAIDQWYYAIGKNNPDSVYWRSRGTTIDLDIRDETFQLLLNTSLEPDLLRAMAGPDGTQDDLAQDGPYMRAYALAGGEEPPFDSVVALTRGAYLRPSLGLDIPGFKGFPPPPEFPVEPGERAAIARFWKDPVVHGPELESPLAAPLPCHRIGVGDNPDAELRSIEDRDGGAALWALLEPGPVRYGDLREQITPLQAGLLARLLRSGVVTAEASLAATA